MATPTLFTCMMPTGISYTDKAVEILGDYKRVAFLSYDSLELEIHDPFSPLLADIRRDAAQYKPGQEIEISASGQTRILGEKAMPSRPLSLSIEYGEHGDQPGVCYIDKFGYPDRPNAERRLIALLPFSTLRLEIFEPERDHLLDFIRWDVGRYKPGQTLMALGRAYVLGEEPEAPTRERLNKAIGGVQDAYEALEDARNYLEAVLGADLADLGFDSDVHPDELNAEDLLERLEQQDEDDEEDCDDEEDEL